MAAEGTELTASHTTVGEVDISVHNKSDIITTALVPKGVGQTEEL